MPATFTSHKGQLHIINQVCVFGMIQKVNITFVNIHFVANGFFPTAIMLSVSCGIVYLEKRNVI